MSELRDKDIIKTPPLKVSPLFGLPKDLDEGSYSSETVISDDSYDDEGNRSILDDDADPDGPDRDVVNPSDRPQPEPDRMFRPTLDPRPLASPWDIKVKSQKSRQAPDGTTVIDVVFEFSDVTGAERYEVRIAT
jgi:hypothetical protein